MKRKLFNFGNTIGMAATLFAASAVQAAENPLHPSHYANKVTAAAIPQGADSEGYRDSGNPLHPSFGQAKMMRWQAATAMEAKPYIDSNNPLHPSYRRI